MCTAGFNPKLRNQERWRAVRDAKPEEAFQTPKLQTQNPELMLICIIMIMVTSMMVISSSSYC